MESPRENNDRLTPSQRRAVGARGNVLVMAGAGTGKTHTLVERCLDCLDKERAAINEILVVTFTEAAAAEMKQRLRRVLEEKARENPGDLHWNEQLALFDTAHIGTLHGFCFKLVREHFYELGLDPQPAVLDEGEARLLADETLEEELQEQYEGSDKFAASVQKLIQVYDCGRDEKIRSVVLHLHHYAQTRPDADGWLAGQIAAFSTDKPTAWQAWLLDEIRAWRAEWLPVLENISTNEKAAELAGTLRRLPESFSREAAAGVLERIVSADGNWPAKRKTVLRKPLEDLFDEAKFLFSLAVVRNENDPLAEDWNWVRGHMTGLLRLAQNFAARFAARKRDDGVLDFHDLEQFALRLLWNIAADKQTLTAQRWRKKLRFIFVDEYQDINAAQDKIIQALSREGADANRFLVGDVKQSIYSFRLAEPKIFRDYANHWRGQNGAMIPLSDNFRSRESLLHFVNSIFGRLMCEKIGGVDYDADAELKSGRRRGEAPDEPTPAHGLDFSPARGDARPAKIEPRTELLLRIKNSRGENLPDDDSSGDLADLEESEKDARLLALRLKALEKSGHRIWDDNGKVFRAAKWNDMAVLLRSPAGKSEIFARQFERAGVPLTVARGGFYDGSEILDWLSLLQLLDNPLQDVPGIAVLRSPLVGCSLDELAEIRLVTGGHFWTALDRVRNAGGGGRNELRLKVEGFLERFSRWRKLVRQVSLSQCLEVVLAETHYADWMQSRPRGAQRRANLDQFLNLAQKFDQFQRQGLFRFLKFIEAQRESGAEPEIAPAADENAVRLMSIHQSKGLEFPVVAVADLAKSFNEQDLRGDIILDAQLGLCPRIQPPKTGARYPSLPHWLAQRRQRGELRGEELRLLYVAMTRARDTLILSGSVTQQKWDELWTKPATVTPRAILSARSFADWLGLWFANQVQSPKSKANNTAEGELPHLRWRIAADEELIEKSDIRYPISERQPPVLDDATAEKLRGKLSWKYPHETATRRAAKSSVTALRREAEELGEEAERLFSAKRPATIQRRKAEGGRRKLAAAEIGVAHHRFLQHVKLEKAGDRTGLATEAQRLEKANILSAEELAALDFDALAIFWDSPPGRKIRAQSADWVKRELPFTARFSPAELARTLGKEPEPGLENEFVVVQGVADLAVLLPKEIWLVDFKTDEVRAGELAGKTKNYMPQLKLYAVALEKIYARPVTNCWLHFLSARKTMGIS